MSVNGLFLSKWGIFACTFLACSTTGAYAQSWDLPAQASQEFSNLVEGKFKIGMEQRVRYERRTGQGFGKDVDLDTGLVRTRLSMTYQPTSWVKFSGMLQDGRAPWYGPKAPNSIRDTADLQEAYFEIRPEGKTGFGMTAGRMMMNYGDARLIGSPQWSNLSRTYDHARLYYRLGTGVRFEVLMVSPVKIRSDDFNQPVLGERIWGTYNTIPKLFGSQLLDVYFLRHDQNRPGGFTGGSSAAGTDRLGVNTWGARMTGPLAHGLKYTVEGVIQNGMVGPAHHRGEGWVTTIARKWKVSGRTLELSGEYKFASGTRNPQDATYVSTFDQISPANHDKFGHADLFGWRNMHNARGLASYSLTRSFALNVMYNNWWLASLKDSLYNSAGKSIARSATGTAGRHVGQESDIFCTYKYGHFIFGAGYGHVFDGEFLHKTTPGKDHNVAYIFHTYTL